MNEAPLMKVENTEIDEISPQELQQLLENNECDLIDVREPEEIAQQFIRGAKFCPTTYFDISQLTLSDKRIVIHCHSGGRGLRMARKLKSQNPSLRISNLKGGMLEWNKAGLPIKYINKTMPIMRQVQIIAGLLVAGGSAASFFLNNKYYIGIPAFVGCGLFLAGASGWCGMKELLKCFPWNK